jgi:hypothetical protein
MTAARFIVKDISKILSEKLKLTGFRITNIVANSEFGFKIDLTKLCYDSNVIKH